MYCSNCGKQNKDGSRFCQYCGRPLIYPTTPPPPQSSAPLPRTPQANSTGKSKVLFIILAIVGCLILVAIGVIAGLSFAQKNHNDNPPAVSADQPIISETDSVAETESSEVEDIQTPAKISLDTLNGGVLTNAAKDYAETISTINEQSNPLTQISLYEKNYSPGTRNTNYTWDRTLFYKLENVSPTDPSDGQLNNYYVERKQLINADTGNLIDYEIYRNPSNSIVNKIVSIEYLGNEILVTDFYYENNGDVSFMYERKESSYVPSYAIPTHDGQRFYFSKDTMVKWRRVTNGHQDNICVGQKEVNKTTNLGSIHTLSEISKDEKKKYDKTEKQRLNQAYNTFKIVLEAPTYQYLTGYVADGNGSLMADARGFLYSHNYDNWIYTFYTDEEGKYNIIVPDEGDFDIYFNNEGYKDINIYNINANHEQVTAYVETAYLLTEDLEDCETDFVLIDAFNEVSNGYMFHIDDALLNFRYGIGNKTGEILQSVRTNSDGKCRVLLEPGSYTVEIQKTGYINSYCTCVVLRGVSEIELNTSPILNTDEVRIVLTWGSTPADLDSHLFTPYDSATQDTTYHIWYGNRFDALYNNLDVDDTDSYGPETMTINHLTNGLYKYYVADYTNCVQNYPTSREMSYSNAKVSVFTSEGLVRQFSVPVDQSGVIWEVFEIRNKQIVPIQRYYNSISNISFWHDEK